MYYLYLIRSLKDSSFYIGQTSDLKRRIHEHNKGKTRSIKSKAPFVLVYFEAYQSKSLSIKREIELKTNSFKKKELITRLF